MNIDVKQPKWKHVEYSRSAIIKAGKTIKKENLSNQEKILVTKVIDNWRAAHAFPLHVIYIHLRRMAANKGNIIVAERLKRLDSIIAKLKREPTMSLWYIQDLGGCRFIVSDIDSVYNYSSKFESSRKRHVLEKTYDYIQNPKPSGYRSLHRVYRYVSDKNDIYNNNMLIEIQFRTHLQHLWATAVETMGLFTKKALKSGQGDAVINRFFALVSSLFAIKENTPLVPNTQNDVIKIKAEIRDINDKNKYLEFLKGIRVAVDNTKILNKARGYFLLILNYDKSRLRIQHFLPGQVNKANEIYSQIESGRIESKIDTVLVRVDSFQALKSAYPNYFSDIKEFVDIVYSEISTNNDR